MSEIYAVAKQLWVVWLALLFVAIVAYAYRPSNRKRFETYRDIPLRDGAASGAPERPRPPERPRATPPACC